MGLLDSVLGGLLPTTPLLPSVTLSPPGVTPINPTSSSSSPPAVTVSSPLSSTTPILSSSIPLSSSLPPSSLPPSSSSFAPASSAPLSSSAPTSAPPDTGSTSISTGVSTEANGAVTTVSNIVFETASNSNTPTTTAAASTHESFLQNKALSGSVFALTGLIVLVIIIVLATLVFRRRRRNRLLDDAVSFDPGLLATAERYDASERGHASNASVGTLGSGRPYGATTYQAQDAYNPYGAQQPQYGGGMPPQQQTYYGAPQQVEYYNDYGSTAQQPYYSNYVPPMTDAPPASLARATSTARPTHNIPRVPVPPKPLPEEFGSSEPDRASVEETEFWARTLKVTNSEE